jgi:hypothetical protein
MGLPLPDDSSKSKSTLKKISHQNFSAEKKDSVAESEKPLRKRETVITLLALVRINYFACNKSVSTQCAKVCLQATKGLKLK